MRRPLAWLIVLEVVVVAALATATYHVLATRSQSPPATAVAPPTPVASPTRPAGQRPPTPKVTTPAPTTKGAPPGVSVDPAFWNDELKRLNADQAALADLQARAVRAVTGWVRAYVGGVLIPAVRAAEKK